jgi:hypothetical protein
MKANKGTRGHQELNHKRKKYKQSENSTELDAQTQILKQ